jgi:D-alanyl-D-alanine carboxypeptidase
MKRWIAALSALFLSALPLVAAASAGQTFTPSMSSAITHLGENEVRSSRTPGLVIGIVEDGRIVYARGFGYANLAKKLAAAADTEFYVGDLTHQFVAAAALMLVQDGKLKLNDKVTKYIPNLTVAPTLTVEQLLQQTSGLPGYGRLSHAAIDFTRSEKPDDLIAALNANKPESAPGTAYDDDSINYLLAGMVVERASGEPLSDFLQQRIFVPLVMSRSFLAGDTGISPTHAIGYTHGAGDFVAARTWDPAWLGGDRGLVTTAYDLAKWEIEMPVLLHVDAVRTMLTPSATPGTAQHAMGWVIDQRGGKNLQWYAGQLAGYQAASAVLPDDHIGVIVLTNADALHGGHVVSAGQLAAHLVDIVSPPATAHLDNAVVSRAKEWLARLAEKNVDRAQLTPEFSAYLSDDLISRADFAALGKLQAIVPISSTAEPNGDTLYEFLVRYPSARYHYKFALTKDGKIDELTLVD